MPKILFIDDEEYRLKALQKIKFFPSDSIVVNATNGDEAINYINNEEWDTIFFDHDLTTFNEKGKEISGFTVASILCEKYFQVDKNKKPACIVHTMNPVGGMKIESLLRDNNFLVQRIPFCNLLKH